MSRAGLSLRSGALVEFHMQSRYGRTPSQHDLEHVTKALGWDKLDGPAGGYTRATAEQVAEEVMEQWREMRHLGHIPKAAPEADEHGDFLGSVVDDLASAQAQTGWGRPSGDPETWQTFQKAFGDAGSEELGSLTADLEHMQRASGWSR